MKNSAKDMFYELYCDYADGVGEHGSVLKEFSSILSEYKNNFSNWQPFHEPDMEERRKLLEGTPKKMLITIAVITIVFLIFHLIFPGYLEWYLFSIVAGVFMMKKSKEGVWLYLMAIMMLISLVIGFGAQSNTIPMVTFLIILLGYAAVAFKNYRKETDRYNELHEKNKSRFIQMKELEERLDEQRKKLFKLLPDLKNEYSDIRRQFIEQYSDCLEDNDKKAYMNLPLAYWWEVKPEKLLEWETVLADNRNEDYDITWEFKCIERKNGSEYMEAGKEFSPFYDFDTDEDTGQKLYDLNHEIITDQNSGGIIADFVALILRSSVGTEIVTYKDYKYNTLQRISKSMEWSAIGDNIQSAYKEGVLSDSDYASLNSFYNSKSWEAYSLINEEVEKNYERGVQIKSSTFLWTGQMMLLPDEKVEKGYILVDYRCQLQHMFENLIALKNDYDITITRVMGDVENRNAAFMAKVHQLFPKCR